MTLKKRKPEKRYRKFFEETEEGKWVKKETEPEKIMRELLGELGFAFQQEYKVCINKFTKVYDFFVYQEDSYCFFIEVDGDFYHAKEALEKKTKLKKWQRKNVNNDKLKNKIAKELGIPLVRVWESDIKNDKEKVKEELRKFLY